MKKVLIFLFIIVFIMLIYEFAPCDDNLVFSIGSTNGDITYSPSDYRITDIIIDIEDNIKVDGFAIQNLLVRSSYINFELNSFFSLKNYTSILSQISDLENLFNVIRKYTKEKIYITLLEEKNILSDYANKKIILLSEKYDIIIVR